MSSYKSGTEQGNIPRNREGKFPQNREYTFPETGIHKRHYPKDKKDKRSKH
jgi:hypothetical protein